LVQFLGASPRPVQVQFFWIFCPWVVTAAKAAVEYEEAGAGAAAGTGVQGGEYLKKSKKFAYYHIPQTI
jgi:hypothetical protein